jgi:hypothetical protein
VDLTTLVAAPTLTTFCGPGVGMAVCPTLGLLVTSNASNNTLSVFKLPRNCGRGEMSLLWVLGGTSSPGPMQFKFNFCATSFFCSSGWMAFTGLVDSRLLVVSDAGHRAVHVIDVVGRMHVGHVAAPGTLPGPRGVAARGSLVAVCSHNEHSCGFQRSIYIFEGSGATWAMVRVIGVDHRHGVCRDSCHLKGHLSFPRGLRFTADGVRLVVMEECHRRLSAFRVEDGSLVGHLGNMLPWADDLEECEGGWLMACPHTDSVEFLDEGDQKRARLLDDVRAPTSLALVRGLGLVVREFGRGGWLRVFATPDIIAMDSMSAERVEWMAAVNRGRVRRATPSSEGRKGTRRS